MTFDIRLLTDADWMAYRDLRLAALRAEPTAFGSEADFEIGLGDTWFQQTLRNNFVFTAVRDGTMVGLAAWRRSGIAKTAHIGGIWGMYVAPSERGHGTGRALLLAVIEHARPSVEALKLSVTADNTAAVRLYEQLGFALHGVEPKTLKIDGRYYDTELRMLWLGVGSDGGRD